MRTLVAGSGSAFALGAARDLYRFDDEGLTREEIPAFVEAAFRPALLGVAPDGTLLVLERAIDAQSSTLIARSVDGSWRAIATGDITAARDVDDVWRMGTGGPEHFDGSNWAPLANVPAGLQLTAVLAAVATDNVWFAATAQDGDRVVHLMGGSFTVMTAEIMRRDRFDPSTWLFEAVGPAEAHGSDGWGTLFHFVDGEVTSEQVPPFTALGARSGSDIFLFGTDGVRAVTRHFDGVSWSSLDTGMQLQVLMARRDAGDGSLWILGARSSFGRIVGTDLVEGAIARDAPLEDLVDVAVAQGHDQVWALDAAGGLSARAEDGRWHLRRSLDREPLFLDTLTLGAPDEVFVRDRVARELLRSDESGVSVAATDAEFFCGRPDATLLVTGPTGTSSIAGEAATPVAAARPVIRGRDDVLREAKLFCVRDDEALLATAAAESDIAWLDDGAWNTLRSGVCADGAVVAGAETWLYPRQTGSSAVAYRFDGSMWRAVTLFGPREGRVFGSAVDDLLCLIDSSGAGACASPGGVVEPLPAIPEVLLSSGAPEPIVGARILTNGEGWAVSQQGRVWRLEGTSWTEVPSAASETRVLRAAGVADDGTLFAAEEVVTGQPIPTYGLVRFDGSSWIDEGVIEAAYERPEFLFVRPGGEIWIHKDAGDVLRLRDGTWTRFAYAYDSLAVTPAGVVARQENRLDVWHEGSGELVHGVLTTMLAPCSAAFAADGDLLVASDSFTARVTAADAVAPPPDGFSPVALDGPRGIVDVHADASGTVRLLDSAGVIFHVSPGLRFDRVGSIARSVEERSRAAVVDDDSALVIDFIDTEEGPIGQLTGSTSGGQGSLLDLDIEPDGTVFSCGCDGKVIRLAP